MGESLCQLGHRICHQLQGSTPWQHISQIIDAMDDVMDDTEKHDSKGWIRSNVHFVMPSHEKEESKQQSGYRVKNEHTSLVLSRVPTWR